MRWLHAVASVLLTLAMPACADDDRLELGAQCEFTTECVEPYVCRIGRCRVECISSRDCPPGAVCLEDNEGQGSCRLPPEAECSADDDCPTILVCAAGRCRNECTLDTDCPDGTCEEVAPELRACQEPTGDLDAGPPIDAGVPPDAGVPTDAGPPTFQRCLGHADCGDGMRCLSLRGEDQICRPTCDTDIGDSDCPGETICMQVSSGVSMVGVCTHRCTVGTSEGCPAGATCDFFSETRDGTDKVFFTECRAFDDGAALCTVCSAGEATACNEGQLCTYDSGRSRCLRLCLSNDDCPAANEKCGLMWAEGEMTFDGVSYGRCQVQGESSDVCVMDGGT